MAFLRGGLEGVPHLGRLAGDLLHNDVSRFHCFDDVMCREEQYIVGAEFDFMRLSESSECECSKAVFEYCMGEPSLLR